MTWDLEFGMCQTGLQSMAITGSRWTMSYRFKLDEKVRDGFIRIAGEQIGRATAELSQSGSAGLPDAVHETRKCLKRLRALLRLVRPGLTQKDFRRENAAMREIAALLSETRDNHVLLETIAKLEARKSDAPLISVKRLAHAGRDIDASAQDPARTATALAGLHEAGERLNRISIAPAGFSTLRRGYERTYGHARSAVKRAYKENDSEAFHELRKHVQVYWRQTQLLSRVWPELMDMHASAARELSQILGDDHDLAILEAFLDRAPKGEIGRMEAKLVRHAIHECQGELRALALPRLQRLFADRPVDIGRRLAVLWTSAKRMRAEGPAQPGKSKPGGIVPQAPSAVPAATEPHPGRAA